MQAAIARVFAIALGLVIVAGCGSEKEGRSATQSDIQKTAMRTYVPPGTPDEFYIMVGEERSGETERYVKHKMPPPKGN